MNDFATRKKIFLKKRIEHEENDFLRKISKVFAKSVHQTEKLFVIFICFMRFMFTADIL